MLPSVLHVIALGVLSSTPLSVHAPAHAPPIGAVYTRTVSLPVIGKQTVELSILSDKLARLILSGRLNLDEPVNYQFHRSGELSFELTEATKRILRRFRTTLDAAGYDGSSDTSWVVVWPPLPLSVRIRLNRVHGRKHHKWPHLSLPELKWSRDRKG
uniref:Uncharacterized protein n=1 Tax=Haptolina ericina TaxID=156174 RepID=A0A7S3EZR3_9EUKA|mmetsp:Transcript_40377/g.91493  ORF Transcript_40377/g.91493 Transcript_40377/m.91493 type:complete len:157 (+) Transcript_40377:106-576(+)